MPGAGLEPARAFAHCHLKTARLPIAPPRHEYGADTPIRTEDPLLTKQPLLTAELCRQGSGADSPDRTDGLPLTRGLLCHLSYIGMNMGLRVGIEPTTAPIPRACATDCAIEAFDYGAPCGNRTRGFSLDRGALWPLS